MKELTPFLNMALKTYDDIQIARERFKERIKKEWEESKKLPQKKKKAIRKRLLMEWSIANYDPYDIFNH